MCRSSCASASVRRERGARACATLRAEPRHARGTRRGGPLRLLTVVFARRVTTRVRLGRCSSVAQSLAQFTLAERLEGDNKYRCERCKTLVNASKRLLLHRTPPVLALQLKRFGYGRYGLGKIGRAISFEETLDLGPYCTVRMEPPACSARARARASRRPCKRPRCACLDRFARRG